MIDDTIRKIFDFMEALNERSPFQLSFTIKPSIRRYYSTQTIEILLHKQVIGNLTIYSGYNGRRKQMNFTIKLNGNYDSEIREEKFRWGVTTQGIIPKCLELVEDMIEESREKIAYQSNNKEWGAITRREFTHLTRNSAGTLNRREVLYKKSSLRFGILVPTGVARHQSPRKYLFTLNGDIILNRKALLIDDPRVANLVCKCDAFERQIDKVFSND